MNFIKSKRILKGKSAWEKPDPIVISIANGGNRPTHYLCGDALIAWSSTRKVTALPLPCLSSVCAGAGARHSESGCPGAPAATNRRCRGAARPREPRGAGEGEGAALSVGLGGARGEAGTKAEGADFVLFFFFSLPPLVVFFPPANPLGATLAKRDAFFIQPPRPGSVKLHFFSEALLRGKKIRSHGSPNALSCGVLFCRHTLCF